MANIYDRIEHNITPLIEGIFSYAYPDIKFYMVNSHDEYFTPICSVSIVNSTGKHIHCFSIPINELNTPDIKQIAKVLKEYVDNSVTFQRIIKYKNYCDSKDED